MSPADVRKVVPFRLSAEEAEIIAAAVDKVERSLPAYYGPRCTLSSFVRHAAVKAAEAITGTLALGYNGTSLEERFQIARDRAASSSRPKGKKSAADRTLPMFPEGRVRKGAELPPDVTGWRAAAAKARAPRVWIHPADRMPKLRKGKP